MVSCRDSEGSYLAATLALPGGANLFFLPPTPAGPVWAVTAASPWSVPAPLLGPGCGRTRDRIRKGNMSLVPVWMTQDGLTLGPGPEDSKSRRAHVCPQVRYGSLHTGKFLSMVSSFVFVLIFINTHYMMYKHNFVLNMENIVNISKV